MKGKDQNEVIAVANDSVAAKVAEFVTSDLVDDSDRERKMPETEKEFERFLNELGKKEGRDQDYEKQVKVERSPFLKRGVHKVDFVLHRRDKDGNEENLYIEVKGVLSYYEVNVLEYLLKHSGKCFYIYQATNEDWMGLYVPAVNQEPGVHSAKEKIKDNKKKQQEEIKKFFSGEFSAEKMMELASGYLEGYKKLRVGDIDRWVGIQKERDLQTEEEKLKGEPKKNEKNAKKAKAQ